jgi:hypothetical protein
MKFNIPPFATETQPYTVSVDEIAQYLTIEIRAPNGNLVIIDQVDDTSSLTIRMQRSDMSLKGKCSVKCAAADQTGQEFSAEFDNLQVS